MIDSQRVEEIFLDCLFRDKELPEGGGPPDNAVIVRGVLMHAGLHPDRLEEHREEVEAMLRQLPNEFFRDGGGGWSFLNACVTSDDQLWTGDQSKVDLLFTLGIALGVVVFQFPREMWAALPGGVPYIVIDLPRSETEQSTT